MGFQKRAGTTGKVAISQAAREEIELVFFHQKVERKRSTTFFDIELDQWPTKSFPHSSHTQAQIDSDIIPFVGSNDKRMITAIFTITSKSFPQVKFPNSLTLSANGIHSSNEQECLKLLDDVIIPYVKKEKEKLELPKQTALIILIIMNVFKGKMTTSVLQNVASNNIQLVKVPPSITHIYQPLDVILNGTAKQFLDWYAAQQLPR